MHFSFSTRICTTLFCLSTAMASLSVQALDLPDTGDGVVNEAAPLLLAAVDSGDLVSMAAGQLGLTSGQAAGGLGSLFSLAQENLSGEEFGQLAAAVPDMQSLLSAVPDVGGGALGSLGAAAGSLAGGAQLFEQFKALGIDPAMISQLAGVAMEYFQGSAESDALTGLLKKGLGSVLG